MGSSSLVIGAIGSRLVACFSQADDGGPGDGMGTNGEAEVGRTGVLVEARCVDVQGRHGDVVIVDAGARRGLSADILVGTGVASQLEGAVGQQGPVRCVGAGGQAGRGGGDVGDDPVPKTAPGRRLRVVHRYNAALPLG